MELPGKSPGLDETSYLLWLRMNPKKTKPCQRKSHHWVGWFQYQLLLTNFKWYFNSASSPTTNSLFPSLQLLNNSITIYNHSVPPPCLCSASRQKSFKVPFSKIDNTYLLLLPPLKYLTSLSHLELLHPHLNLLKYHIFYKNTTKHKKLQIPALSPSSYYPPYPFLLLIE